mgnify:FL=1
MTSYLKNLGRALRNQPRKTRGKSFNFNTEAAVPVVAIKRSGGWELTESPQRLIKEYEFDSRKVAKNFINEILEYEDQVSHHGEVTIDHNKVLIEVFTQDLNCVTELDYEYAKMSDAIFHDVGHYSC